MTTDQPVWATDPLPPAVLDRAGRVWPLGRALDSYFGETPASLERDYGPIVPLWPTDPLPKCLCYIEHPISAPNTDPKGTTMTTENQPAWATDPRGLPPAYIDEDGDVWVLGTSTRRYRCGGYHLTVDEMENDFGPLTPLWPDTPPTSPLPDLSRWHPVPVGATIPAGTRYAYEQYGNGLPIVSTWDEPYVVSPGSPPRYTEHPIPAPDDDAELLHAISETVRQTLDDVPLTEDALTLTARNVLNAIKKEQS